ncbi:MAG: DUF3644 domain-containing protein [Lachnospiraceae bacterium]|nr:DUF3644 domain-containing protein [Lachnospiraceae bacterium]
MDKIEEKLIEKSKEVFCLAIELYNKPTIKYRVEGFSHFICNAWELMLKAYMIKTSGENSIYYKNNPQRTLALENCIKIIFTNDKDPLRINLEKIIELRNTSTHFITEEYEMVYIPLFQACVFNFNEKMMAFHNIDMTTIIPQNFLTLSVSMKALSEAEIIAKYPEPIATRFMDLKNSVEDLSINNNAKFAIRIDHHYYITKNKDKATNIVHFDKNAVSGITVVKELQDPNNTHKYTAKSCIDAIKERLHREHIELSYNEKPTKFTSFHFTNFCKYYSLKENKKLCYVHRQYATPQYTYSQQMIDFILDEIRKDPTHILDNIKK